MPKYKRKVYFPMNKTEFIAKVAAKAGVEKKTAAAMQKVYGKDIVHVCGTCCNRQTNPDDTKHKICIAFGTSPMVDCTWGEDKRACGLYNRPFRGLRPVRVPLVEIYGPEEKVPQESLFN